MKTKRLIVTFLASMSVLFGKTFFWTEEIPVVRSEPVYRTVTIRTPYEVCFDRKVPFRRSRDSEVAAAAVAGAVAGGVLGHQIGKGHGRDAASIGGAVAGALLGADLAAENRYGGCRRRRVCETRYRVRKERRRVGFRNIAWYRGYKIVKRSKYKLRTIKLHLRARY